MLLGDLVSVYLAALVGVANGNAFDATAIDLSWFNQTWPARRHKEGQEVAVSGKVTAFLADMSLFPGYDTVMGKDTATVAEVLKQSGYGKDMSIYSIEEYTNVKHVMASLD